MTPDDETITLNSHPLESKISNDTAVALTLNGMIRKGIELLCGSTTREGMLTLADQAVASTTNFLTGVIIGRACTKEEFGLYMLGFTILFFATDLHASLVSTPYMIYSPRLKGRAHSLYTGSSLIHELGLSVMVIIVLVVGGGCSASALAPKSWPLWCGHWLW